MPFEIDLKKGLYAGKREGYNVPPSTSLVPTTQGQLVAKAKGASGKVKNRNSGVFYFHTVNTIKNTIRKHNNGAMQEA